MHWSTYGYFTVVVSLQLRTRFFKNFMSDVFVKPFYLLIDNSEYQFLLYGDEFSGILIFESFTG